MKEGTMPTATTKPYKAIIAAVLAGLAALVATIQGKGDTLSSPTDWLVIIVAALVTGFATYQVPNPPA